MTDEHYTILAASKILDTTLSGIKESMRELELDSNNELLLAGYIADLTVLAKFLHSKAQNIAENQP